MNQGSSGGGWLRDTNAEGLGYLDGVNSHARRGYPDTMFSPYYGDAVQSLYDYVVNEI